MSLVCNYLDSFLKDNTTKAIMLLITAVFIGYIIQPLPANLLKLIETCFVVKYVIGVMFLLPLLYPYGNDKNKILIVLIVPLVVILFLEIMKLIYHKYSKNSEMF